jgi:hypothetical protein
MTLAALISMATKGPLPREALDQAAEALGLPLPDLFDQFARAVAHDYLQGHLTWSDADAAINELQGAVISFYPSLLDGRDLMWEVYLAFDEGEWNHANPLDLQGEELTTALLRRIEGRGGSAAAVRQQFSKREGAMREWRTKLGWVGAFTVPFVILSVFLIVADDMRHRWPPEWAGKLDYLAMVVAATSGLLFIPRRPWPANVGTGVLYLLGMLGALFIFGFWFVGAVYGDFL